MNAYLRGNLNIRPDEERVHERGGRGKYEKSDEK